MIALAGHCISFIAIYTTLTSQPISASKSGFVSCECGPKVEVSKGGNASITCKHISNPSSIKARRWDIIKDNVFDASNSEFIIALEENGKEETSNENGKLLFNKHSGSLTLVLYNVQKPGTYGFRIQEDNDLIKPGECNTDVRVTAELPSVQDNNQHDGTSATPYWLVFLFITLLLGIVIAVFTVNFKKKRRRLSHRESEYDGPPELITTL